MSVEKALIARARPHMLEARARAVFDREVSKGCTPDITAIPVALEPCFAPINQSRNLLSERGGANFIVEPLPQLNDMVRLQIWLSPDQPFSWLNSELFIKQLRSVSYRVGFEIVGNREKILIRFLVHLIDLPIIQTAFRGQFELCELSNDPSAPFNGLSRESWRDIVFMDCYPPPPYSELLTRPDELNVSTYRSLIASLMVIEPPATGIFQALLQPVSHGHNWHQNVQVLLDLEYTYKLVSGIQVPQRYLQQAPSGDLRQMAWEVETKAHNDKPFFAIAIRLAIVSAGQSGPAHLKALATFVNLFQHGGCPLRFVTEKDYEKVVPGENIRNMFVLGSSHRPGFLVNSSELVGFVHIPPATILENRLPPLSLLETVPVKNEDLQSGTPLGICEYAGAKYPVCIPAGLRSRSTHIIGRPGHAKSTTMARMILDDIDKGMGVAVIDPHGDLVESLLCTIKKEHVERTIFFDPGNSDFVPLWNPLKRNRGQDVSRTADDLVGAFKSVVTGWGDRMEHLLRHGLFALLQLSDSSLLDLSDLLRHKTDHSNRIRKKILGVVDNRTAYQFWKNDFDRYTNEALGPPKHKLSKLLVSGTVSLMLSQPENRIDLRQIMDEGMVLLVNLSTIGSEVREILGCFILSLFHLSALGRSEIAMENRKQFHIYADEAHRFLTDALEDLIAETRKFGVSLTLAHHYLSQFKTKQADALSSVATTIIMNVDAKDARHLTKDLQKLVHFEDLINLKVGEAVARIGTDIVRLKTHGPLEIPEHHFKDEIIKRSLELYYKPVSEVRELVRHKDRPGKRPFTTLPAASPEMPDTFDYDEF